jgi:hypothetical protein
VAQVLAAPAAQELHPVAAMRIQRMMVHALLYLFPKTREAGADLEFILCLKQHLPAKGASINAGILFVAARIYFLFSYKAHL